MVGGALLAVAPFGAHTLSAHGQSLNQTCITIPVLDQTVCVPPDGVPALPALPSPPNVPVPPAPTPPALPSLPQIPLPPIPSLPQLPPPPNLPDLPTIPLPPIPSIPALPGTGTPAPSTGTAAASADQGGVCALPSLAGQLVGQPVQTALNGVLGTAKACPGK
ncbi:MAG: hypothetical protein JO148_16305 [Acidimicrobiia bacterium]|nr:hypothetical protein [Acidimicrobiia bacterium]